MTLNVIYGLSRCLYGDLPILGEMRDNKMDGINGFEREREREKRDWRLEKSKNG